LHWLGPGTLPLSPLPIAQELACLRPIWNSTVSHPCVFISNITSKADLELYLFLNTAFCIGWDGLHCRSGTLELSSLQSRSGTIPFLTLMFCRELANLTPVCSSTCSRPCILHLNIDFRADLGLYLLSPLRSFAKNIAIRTDVNSIVSHLRFLHKLSTASKANMGLYMCCSPSCFALHKSPSALIWNSITSPPHALRSNWCH
jgi:hypothetical protein